MAIKDSIHSLKQLEDMSAVVQGWPVVEHQCKAEMLADVCVWGVTFYLISLCQSMYVRPVIRN